MLVEARGVMTEAATDELAEKLWQIMTRMSLTPENIRMLLTARPLAELQPDN
jgi:hypothetical protein